MSIASKKGNMEKTQAKPAPFRTCRICNATWQTREDFISDPDIVIVGYQVHFKALTEGFFLFNHNCRDTISIKAGEFSDLYKGPMFENRLAGTDECPGHCLHEEDLGPCPSECECAYVREIIRIIKNCKKAKQSTNAAKNTNI
jgi:hypothetical protein